MAEHSSNASCPVINQVIVQLQDRPHVFNNVSAVEKLKLFFWHQPVHVFPRCTAGPSSRFKHFLQFAFFQKISCISDKGSLQTFCRIIKGFAVMFAARSKTDFYQSPVFCTDSLKLESVEPSFCGFASAGNCLRDFMWWNVSVFTDCNRCWRLWINKNGLHRWFSGW